MVPRALLTRLLTAVVATLVAVLPVPGVAAAATESYGAMGDSYTAGPGSPNQLPDPVGCWRSDNNYPHLVARAGGSVSGT